MEKSGIDIAQWIIAVVAVLALLRPEIVSLWLRLFKPTSIKTYPSGWIEVGYSNYGPSVSCLGTLRAINGDFFVNSMSIRVEREKDGSTHDFEWITFNSLKADLTQPDKREIELPGAFYVHERAPHRYYISFRDNGQHQEMNNALERYARDWYSFAESVSGASYDQDGDCSEAFTKHPIHIETWNNVQRMCYWEAGSYRLTLYVKIDLEDKQVFLHTVRFTISENDSKSLQANTISILRTACGFQENYYHISYSKIEETTS
jgi:hypothetical protein